MSIAVMPVIPDLRRFESVDDSTVTFKGTRIPKGWEMSENVWAVVQRVERIQDAATSLYDEAVALLKSASAYVKLINRRDDFLFLRDETFDMGSRLPTGSSTINNVLSLCLRTGAVTSWNADYFAARKALEDSIAAFTRLATDSDFLQNAYQRCPMGSMNRANLEEWYEGKVQALVLEAPKWTKFTFTFRDILLEIAYRRGGTMIVADVLANADVTRRGGISLRRQLIYELGFGSIDVPKCRLAWVSDKLADDVRRQEQGTGPLL